MVVPALRIVVLHNCALACSMEHPVVPALRIVVLHNLKAHLLRLFFVVLTLQMYADTIKKPATVRIRSRFDR